METTYVKTGDLDKTGAYERESYSSAKTSLVRTILYIVYSVIPISAGADKFLNLLTDWKKYINPLFLNIIPVSGELFMMIAGAVEIAAGILVLAKPKIGSFVVSLWLVLIALQLLAGWMYVDVAVRDIAMAAGAFCLSQLEN